MTESDVLSAPDDIEAFAADRDYYTLGEAVILVGCLGKPLTWEEVVKQGADDAGERTLFAALEKGSPLATGRLLSTKLREEIPCRVWESAGSSEKAATAGHYVRYIDDERCDELGGMLALHQEGVPPGKRPMTWGDIRIEKSSFQERFGAPLQVGDAQAFSRKGKGRRVGRPSDFDPMTTLEAVRQALESRTKKPSKREATKIARKYFQARGNSIAPKPTTLRPYINMVFIEREWLAG